jgi:membrane protease YdiL (CAAX protease family)
MSGYSLTSSINKLRSSSFILFITFLLVIYLLMVIGVYTIFPTQNTFPHLARNGMMAFLVIIFIITSKRLLKRDSFAPDLLDLSISAKSLILFFLGGGISILIIASMAGLLWLLVPYHFELQELSTPYILKELHSYFWNNFMEELMFRGYHKECEPIAFQAFAIGRPSCCFTHKLSTIPASMLSILPSRPG